MTTNKVIYSKSVLIDLTEDTVTPETLLAGVTAHAASGEKIVGTFDPSVYCTKAAKVLTSSDDLNNIQGFQSFEWTSSVPQNAPKPNLTKCSGVAFGSNYKTQIVSTSADELYYRIGTGAWHRVALWN